MRKIVTLLVAAWVLAGCALTDDTVAVPYQPSDAARLADAGPVGIAVVDSRTADRNRISTKKNTYGMEMGAIRPERPVSDIVRDALTQEFERRGFHIEPGQRLVTIAVDRFYNDFDIGFWAVTAKGDVQLTVTVADPAGAQLFNRPYAGTSEDSSLAFGSSAAGRTVGEALKDALAKLFADPDFMKALAVSAPARPLS